MQQMFPLSEERHIILAFLAELMHGFRQSKKVAVLTDRRDGNKRVLWRFPKSVYEIHLSAPWRWV